MRCRTHPISLRLQHEPVRWSMRTSPGS